MRKLLRVDRFFVPAGGAMTISHRILSGTERNLMQLRRRGVREVLIDACCGKEQKLHALQVNHPNCRHLQPHRVI